MRRLLPLIGALAFCFVSASFELYGAEFTVEENEHGVTVKIDGELFTNYLITSEDPRLPKPILWPVIGPTGKPVTRAFPMERIKGEAFDHPHQRSFWFTHGEVGGADFWAEGRGRGTIAHRKFTQVEGGSQAVIASENEWLDGEGKKLLDDSRRLVFRADGDSRTIDFDVVLTAADDPVKFGDTKEGSFGVRVAPSMKVDAGQGGRIVNAEGVTDRAAWGKQSPWVDYHGPVDGEVVGIAILNHPSSFRYPTYWHVRTYGLFAANPFGWHHFQGNDAVDGSYTLQPGESLTLRYRVLLHKGDEKAGEVAEAFAAYAKEP